MEDKFCELFDYMNYWFFTLGTPVFFVDDCPIQEVRDACDLLQEAYPEKKMRFSVTEYGRTLRVKINI